MTFLVEVQHRLTVVQGLPSPVRARRGLPPMPPGISQSTVTSRPPTVTGDTSP